MLPLSSKGHVRLVLGALRQVDRHWGREALRTEYLLYSRQSTELSCAVLTNNPLRHWAGFQLQVTANPACGSVSRLAAIVYLTRNLQVGDQD